MNWIWASTLTLVPPKTVGDLVKVALLFISSTNTASAAYVPSRGLGPK
jgi:hypothetical protein